MPDGSLGEFERKVEQDRAALAASLDRLTRAADPQTLEAQATELAEHYGNRALAMARENPAALALLGVGATMLVAGLGARSERPLSGLATRPGADPAAVPPMEAMEGFDARVRAADSEMRDYDEDDRSISAAKMRAALENGLSRLPAPARRRIIDLRLKAIDAQEEVERQARKGLNKAGRTIRRRPIETGALALGLGAVIAAILPATRTEDRHLGRYRDNAIGAATDALRRETDALAARIKTNADVAPREPGLRARS